MSTEFAPTAEQQHALDLFKTGQTFAIEAGAGTGKTSTLLLLAKSTTQRGQYVAFNRDIVRDSRTKFPANVNCSTAHSLAYKAIAAGTAFEDRQRSGKRMRSIDIANRLGTDPVRVTTFEGESKQLSSTFLAGLAMRAVTRFCQSADAEPSWKHVPTVPGLDSPAGPKSAGSVNGAANREVAKAIERSVKRAWSDLSTPEGGLPFTRSIAMAVYLKLWQLSSPRIGADFILFDEAQDANPVMVAVIAAQTHAQIVWVGDSQQQIYAFTGAVNALSTVPAESRAFLTQSFRFGPAVADIANRVLELIPSAELRLKGFDKVASTVGPVGDPDVILCRTNAEALRHVLRAIENEKTVHLIGGGKDIVSFVKAAQDLQNGRRTEHPELACFDNWGEVQDYVEQDEQGSDLKLLVGIIDEFGVDTILAALDTQAREEDADLVVSTAHKAKGREWGSVQIASDFQEDKILGRDDELRLLYVACTRAKNELDVDAIPFLRDGYVPTAETAKATAPAPQKPAERVAAPAPKRSSHVGTVGQRIDFTATVESVKGMTTKYGWTHLTRLVDADGNIYKAFLDEELESGATYEVSAKVKGHDEFRGVNETSLNYVDATQVEAVEGESTDGEERVTEAEAITSASVAVVDDGEPF